MEGKHSRIDFRRHAAEFFAMNEAGLPAILWHGSLHPTLCWFCDDVVLFVGLAVRRVEFEVVD
jgi:hypothetical protein